MEGEDHRALEAAHRGDAGEIRRLRAEGVEVNAGFEAGPSPMEMALQMGHTDAFWALLEGAAPELWEDALCLAAFLGSVPTFEALLARGVPATARDEVGENAMASAAKGEGDRAGRLAIARRLLAEGVDPEDAIEYATRDGDQAMLAVLSGAG